MQKDKFFVPKVKKIILSMQKTVFEANTMKIGEIHIYFTSYELFYLCVVLFCDFTFILSCQQHFHMDNLCFKHLIGLKAV